MTTAFLGSGSTSLPTESGGPEIWTRRAHRVGARDVRGPEERGL